MVRIYVVLVLIVFTLVSCNNSKERANTKEVTRITKSSPFIKGLKYIKMTTTREADKRFVYVPHFPDSVLSPYEFEYQIDMELCYEKAYYDIQGEKITGYLPINIDYESDHKLLLGKDSDNDLIFGEYDFNKDGVNEIIIGFRDNNGSTMGLQINVIRYIPPPKTETVFCDYWVTIKDIHIKDIAKDTYANIINDRIEIINPKNKVEPFIFDKAAFEKAIPEVDE